MKISAIVFAILAGMAMDPFPDLYVRAAELGAYDRTAVEEDLRGVDLSAYPAVKDGAPGLLGSAGFEEYAYSDDEALSRENFGIYLYVYNPGQLTLSERTGANEVNMATAYNAQGEPSDYSDLPLVYLDKTDDGLIYKFKVAEAESEALYASARAYALAHGGTRRYDLAGLQLYEQGAAGAKDHEVARTYFCTGFGAGCGSDPGEESTLSYRVQSTDVISLELRSTSYLFPWLNENAHQDQLSSVYFGIEKGFTERYGELSAVKCSWDERRTSPIVVTRDPSLYAMMSPWVGQRDGFEADEVFGVYEGTIPNAPIGKVVADWGWGYSPYTEGAGTGEGDVGGIHCRDTTPAGYVFLDESADGEAVSVTSEEMKRWIAYHGKADYLFRRETDEGRTYGPQSHVFYADEPFDLLSFDDTHSGFDAFALHWREFWSFFNKSGLDRWEGPHFSQTGGEVSSIVPIKHLTDADFTGDPAKDAAQLFVHADDFDSFKAYYDRWKPTKDLFLLRFAVTDYYARGATVITGAEWSDPTSWLSGKKDKDSTYIAEETVFLDFDVIDLTFRRDSAVTVLGVVSDPIDVVGAIEKPLSQKGSKWWVWCIAAGGVLIAGLIAAIAAERFGGGHDVD